MGNYFIRGVPVEKGAELDRASIPWKQIELDGTQGILLGKAVLTKALKTLKVALVAGSEEPPTREGITCVSVQPEAERPLAVKTIGWDDEADEKDDEYCVFKLSEVAKQLLPKIGCDVVIHHAYGEVRKPQYDKRFHIFIQSSPSGTRNTEVPGRLWGFDVNDYEDAFSPSGQGAPIVDPDMEEDIDYVAAELVGNNNLYIHHNVAESGDDDDADIFRCILEAAIELRGLSSAERKARQVVRRRVRIARWDGYGQDAFKAVLREVLLPAVETDIVFSVPHSYSEKPHSDGKFHVHVWSSPTDREKRVTPPNHMWGIEVDCPDDAFLPTGTGVSILDAESGWVVAELINGNNLYIHHDVVHTGSQRELLIFRRILEETVAELTLDPEEKAIREQQRLEAINSAARGHYVTLCGKGHAQKLDEMRQQVDSKKEELSSLQKKLTALIREIDATERTFGLMVSGQNDDLDIYGKEYDNLLAIPQVKKVEAGTDKVFVYTNTLYCTDPRSGIMYDIGAFRIEIYLSGLVFWFNLTRRVDAYKPGMHAPHVDASGKACLGNMAEVFPELIARYEFATVAQLAIEFVQTVNVTDAGERWGPTITSWPVAKKEEVTHA